MTVLDIFYVFLIGVCSGTHEPRRKSAVDEHPLVTLRVSTKYVQWYMKYFANSQSVMTQEVDVKVLNKDMT